MSLDPSLRAVLDEIATWPARPAVTPENMWFHRAGQYRELAFGPAYEEVADVTDHVADGRDGAIRVKTFTPAGLRDATTPALLRIHGGGMVVGSPDWEDLTSRLLANALGCRVFGVAYRLAPEHPFPAGLHDCVDALRWLHAEAASLQVDPDRIAVLGHSAGALLTLSTALALRGEGPRVRRYVALEPTVGPDLGSASWAEYGDGTYLLEKGLIEQCWDWYLAGAEPTPLAAPALATDDELRGLDPVAIITCECDPLRDEGEAFARRLAAAGVDVEQRRFDGILHGSIGFSGRAPVTRALLDELVELLRRALAAD